MGAPLILTIEEARELAQSKQGWPELPSNGCRILVVSCRHHWVIEPAATAKGNLREQSRGVCANCGQVKMFKNSSAPTYYDRMLPKERETLVESYEGLLERLRKASEQELLELVG